MVAACLGWTLDKTEDIIEPIIAEQETVTDAMTVAKGNARGVSQTGRGWMNGEELITLVFRAAIGEPDPRDRVVIDGEPSIDSTIKGGVNGDVATCAIVVNAIPSVVKAQPGLRTMADTPIVTAIG
jgi:4-hydroxy-tetrahydrodipicolinate reductase